MKKKLLVVGASEIARIALEYFRHDSDYEIIGLAVDRAYVKQPIVMGLPLHALEEIERHAPPSECDAFVAIGSSALNRTRMRKYEEMKAKGYTLASYVSSRAFVWRNVELGDNCFILEDNTIQPFVKIGNNVTLWSGNHIGHGSTVCDHVFITSHVVISGFCVIGARSFMGVNSATSEGIKIGEDNFIAIGASVTRSTEPDQLLQSPRAEVAKVSAKRFSRVRDGNV
jgi:sugar O-acyltransferase (sialic acid O-acetyltransferase NeuD family)